MGRGRNAARKQVEPPASEVQVGDTIVMQAKQDKHKARDAFVVTGCEKDKVQAQKLLHPLEPGKVKIMSKVYSTDTKHVVVARKAQQSWSFPQLPEPAAPSSPVSSSPKYDPVNPRFWSNEDESDEEVEANVLGPVHAPNHHAAEVELEVDGQDSSEDNEEDSYDSEEEQSDNTASDQESSEGSDGSEADVEDNAVEEQDNRPLEVEVPPLDQSRRPKRGDVISYGIELATEHERWGEAVVTSASRTPHYYNVQRLDTHEKLGIWLLPNTAWHFGPRLECERAPLLHPNSRETSPLLLRREEREFRYQFEVDQNGEPLLLTGELSDNRQ